MEKRDEEFLRRINETFRIEADEHLNAFSQGLNNLEKDQSQERYAEILETMFREIHSLKGAARSIDRRDIEAICQPLESVLFTLKKHEYTSSLFSLDLFYKTIAIITKLNGAEGSVASAEDRQNNKELVRLLKEFSEGSNPANDNVIPGQVKKMQIVKVYDESPFESPKVSEISKSRVSVSTETVRIRTSILDPLLMQAEELIQAKKAISQRIYELREINICMAGSQMEARLSEFTRSMERDQYSLDSMIDSHLEDLRQILMLPISTITEAFHGMVRQVSRENKKEIELIIKGAELEIDKRILDELKDPLIHLIRNSIDHGIGSPQERIKKHKPPVGTIMLVFTALENGIFEITLSDDGKGIDKEKVKNSAVRSGVVSDKAALKLKPEEIVSLIYQSGISTSSFITDMSGRGLGLSIVHEKVEKLNGTISIQTTVNNGTTFRILVPVALSTFRGILVRTGELMFILPVMNVEKVLNIKQEDIKTVENHSAILLDGQVISLVRLGEVLGLTEHNQADAHVKQAPFEISNLISLFVLASEGNRIAFRIDEICDEQQVLVKSMGKLLKRVKNISGATILGSGKVVPVLHTGDLVKSALNPANKPQLIFAPVKSEEKIRHILVADDSITSRTLIRNILETAGYKITTAVDGMDAFTKAHINNYDLIVSDVDMPRMNGFELIVKVRQDKRINETPVILVTALGSEEDRERGVEVGADAYIVKNNFDQTNLLEIIKKLI